MLAFMVGINIYYCFCPEKSFEIYAELPFLRKIVHFFTEVFKFKQIIFSYFLD